MKRFASDRVQGIMKTLGFTDDVALESKMVSRTIEGAQTRVEGYNFDMRKHVVEYDDVINRQRETIYRERDRILRSESLGPTIEAMLDDEVAALIAEHTTGDHPDEWNLDGLRTQLTTMVPSLTDADLRVLDDTRDTGALTEQLIDLVRERYERKRTETGDPAIGILERLVLLRVIDTQWVDHLTAVDDMRRGIGLRAYSQREPLNEFKIEAYRMFDELKSTIRRRHPRSSASASAATRPASTHGPQRHRGPGGGGRCDDLRGRRGDGDRRRGRWQRHARGAKRPRSGATTRAGADQARSTSAATGRSPATDRWRAWGGLSAQPADGTDRTGCRAQR